MVVTCTAASGARCFAPRRQRPRTARTAPAARPDQTDWAAGVLAPRRGNWCARHRCLPQQDGLVRRPSTLVHRGLSASDHGKLMTFYGNAQLAVTRARRIATCAALMHIRPIVRSCCGLHHEARDFQHFGDAKLAESGGRGLFRSNQMSKVIVIASFKPKTGLAQAVLIGW